VQRRVVPDVALLRAMPPLADRVLSEQRASSTVAAADSQWVGTSDGR
jgi:hypothetical protein